MTDKAMFEVESPESGFLVKIVISERDVVPVSTVIAYVGGQGERIAEEQVSVKEISCKEESAKVIHKVENEPNIPKSEERIFISPRARRFAKEHGLEPNELNSLTGSGPFGRIIEQDVLNNVGAEGIKATPIAEKRPRSME
jgi:pyruvate dehydrogenase E2 component (dihydrolipoamide acetyltransferase)